MKFGIDLYFTLALACLALVVGYLLIDRIALLVRYSIPAAVVGGLLFAATLTALRGFGGIEVDFDGALLTPLNIAFFTSVGLAADARALAKGGKTLLLFFAVVALGLVMQNTVGTSLALLFDLNPVNGLLAGSITLSGGHGTGAAWAGKFLEQRNVQGAVELAVASATFGLVAGGVIGGPLAGWLIRRHALQGGGDKPAADAPAGEAPGPGPGPGPGPLAQRTVIGHPHDPQHLRRRQSQRTDRQCRRHRHRLLRRLPERNEDHRVGTVRQLRDRGRRAGRGFLTAVVAGLRSGAGGGFESAAVELLRERHPHLELRRRHLADHAVAELQAAPGCAGHGPEQQRRQRAHRFVVRHRCRRGVKADLIAGPATFTMAYNQTGRGADYRTPHGGWAGYTFMIVQSFNRAGEKALPVGGSHDFAALGMPGLALTAYIVNGRDVIDPANGVPLPDTTEYDLTLDYRFSAPHWPAWTRPLWVRARAAHVDHGSAGVTDDYRIILNCPWVLR
jgi:hypothetical protein